MALVPNTKKHLSNYWHNRAFALNRSALILYESNGGRPSELSDPCLLLAGLAIEVISKAILIKVEQKFNEKKYAKGHPVSKLALATGALFNSDQIVTLHVFEESVMWLGKYPAVKGDTKDDSKFKELFEVHAHFGSKLRKLHPSEPRWPTQDNYLAIWNILVKCYDETPTDNPNEFGYKLRGIER